MKQFSKEFNLGTLVQISGDDDFYKIIGIHPQRTSIELEGWTGTFHRNHISKYKNKQE